jgi:predicted nucleic acid-binding protein
MRYLDANLFIYAALSPDSEEIGISSRYILERVFGSHLNAATSSLTWDEVVWAIRKLEGVEVASLEGGRFLSFPKLTILNVSESTVNRAQALLKTYGLKPRDAIHAACCMENGIDEIISDDSDFDDVKGIKRIEIKKAAKMF